MNELIVSNVNKYARMLAEKKYLQSGFIAVKEDDGIVITKPRIDYSDVKEDDLVFVNDKNIESLEGNFRAAAVILFCAIRQDKKAGAAAIVDSDSTVEFSKKRKTIMPILDDLAQVCGVSVKCAGKNVASDVVAALSGQRNVCLLPEAGAVVTGRTLDEVFTATLVLDKACNIELLTESKGGTQHMNALDALLEHVVFKLKYSKTNQKQQKAAESGELDKFFESNGKKGLSYGFTNRLENIAQKAYNDPTDFLSSSARAEVKESNDSYYKTVGGASFNFINSYYKYSNVALLFNAMV